MAAMACANCGVVVPDAARVCPKCGYVFSSQQRAAARDIQRPLVAVAVAAAAAGALLALLFLY